jgi:hypothetical protein
MRKICDDEAVINGTLALQTHALAASLRLHVDDGVVVDYKVDLVTHDASKTHGCSLTLGDVADTSTSVFVGSVDEVEEAEEVASVQLLVELVGVGNTDDEHADSKVSLHCVGVGGVGAGDNEQITE